MVEFNRRVSDTCDSMRLKFVQPRHVFDEFLSAGVIEKWSKDGAKFYRFKYRIGTLTDMMSKAIGVPLESRFDFVSDDYGTNESEFVGAKPWKGSFNSRLRV
jgi:hypothetical protein